MTILDMTTYCSDISIIVRYKDRIYIVYQHTKLIYKGSFRPDPA